MLLKKTARILILVFFAIPLPARNTNFQLPENTVKIAFGGDTHFVWGIIDTHEKNEFSLLKEGVKDLLSSFDFRALNLETAFSEKPVSTGNKSYVFRSDPKYIEILKYWNINLAIFANNHAMDSGLEGLHDTMQLFRSENLPYIGIGTSLDQAFSPYITTIQGIKFAFLAISFVASNNEFANAKQPGIAGMHPLLFQKVREVKTKEKCDYVFLSVHWGREYDPLPTEEQKKWAQIFLQRGVDFVVGHHPHLPQGIEIKNNKAVVYSLGNFLFGSMNYFQENNILAVFHFENTKKSFLGMEIIPVTGINRKYNFTVKIPPQKERLELFKNLYVASKKLNPDQEIWISSHYDSLFFKAR